MRLGEKKELEIRKKAIKAGLKGIPALGDVLDLIAEHPDRALLILNVYKDMATYGEMGITVDTDGQPLTSLTSLQRQLFDEQRTSFSMHLRQTVQTRLVLGAGLSQKALSLVGGNQFNLTSGSPSK